MTILLTVLCSKLRPKALHSFHVITKEQILHRFHMLRNNVVSANEDTHTIFLWQVVFKRVQRIISMICCTLSVSRTFVNQNLHFLCEMSKPRGSVFLISVDHMYVIPTEIWIINYWYLLSWARESSKKQLSCIIKGT